MFPCCLFTPPSSEWEKVKNFLCIKHRDGMSMLLPLSSQPKYLCECPSLWSIFRSHDQGEDLTKLWCRLGSLGLGEGFRLNWHAVAVGCFRLHSGCVRSTYFRITEPTGQQPSTALALNHYLDDLLPAFPTLLQILISSVISNPTEAMDLSTNISFDVNPTSNTRPTPSTVPHSARHPAAKRSRIQLSCTHCRAGKL